VEQNIFIFYFFQLYNFIRKVEKTFVFFSFFILGVLLHFLEKWILEVLLHFLEKWILEVLLHFLEKWILEVLLHFS